MAGNPISGGDIQKNIEILVEARIKGQEKINALKKELEGVGATGRETGKSLGGLGNSIENIEGNFSKLTKKLSEQKKELSELKEHSKIESAFAKFTDVDAISKTEAKIGMQEQILDAQKAVELTSKKLNDAKTQLKELMKLEDSQRRQEEKRLTDLIRLEEKNVNENIKNVARLQKAKDIEDTKSATASKKTAFFNEAYGRFGATQAETIRGMRMAGIQFDEFGDITDMAKVKVTDFWDNLGEGVRKAKPFRPELLGIMFAGQGLNRAFGNLTATAKDWVGVNELLSESIGVVMLPAMLDLLEMAVLPLSDALINLPEPLQKIIGIVAMSGEAVGSAIGMIGSIGLAFNAAEKFGFDLSVIKGIGGTIGKHIVTGMGVAIAAYNMVQDFVFDEEGNMEIGNKIGAAIGLGIATKNPYVAAGYLVASTLFEAITDPKGFGKFAFDMVNNFGKALDGLTALGDWIGTKIYNSFANSPFGQLMGLKSKRVSLDTTKWADEVARGFSEAYDKAFEEGRLSDYTYSLMNDTPESKEAAKKYAWSSGVLTMPTSTPIGQGGAGSLISLLQGRAVGGNIGTTGPYLLHAGETVIPKNQSSEGVTLVVTYNVNVSDKREFEQLIERNNRQLTQEVRRLIQ